MNDQLKQRIQRDLERVGSVVFEGMLTFERNKVPESIFVNYFLPRFVNLNNINGVDPRNHIVEWISIAGSPMAEVSVVSDSTGEELFVVPAYLSTNHLSVGNGDTDCATILKMYEAMSRNIPKSGANYLINALGGKAEQMLSTNTLEESVARWQAIFRRYNLIQDTGPAVGAGGAGGEDLFDY